MSSIHGVKLSTAGKVDIITDWCWVHILWVYISVWKYQCEEVQMVLDGSKLMNRCKWHMSFDLWACTICACFCKGESVIVLWLNIRCAHVVVVLCKAAIVLQNKYINFFRDVATGPTLSLTTNHMRSLHSLISGISIQWSECRSCIWLCLLLLSTLYLYRFQFHTQVMILARSYKRLSILAITSVDGCCLYIIIHNSMSHRTWS